jgi:hypothetical protein
MVHELDEGAHLFLRAKFGAPDAMRHMMGISVTRVSAEHVQVNLINSNGWYELTGKPGLERMPAMAKFLPIDLASAGLASLLDEVIERPARGFQSERGRRVWDSSPSGAPLTAWLRELDSSTPLQHTAHDVTPQKGSECIIEMNFAWLATVLPPADYKLAKANVLNVLRQTAEANAMDEEVMQRLDERITSSLSGHAMAPALDHEASSSRILSSP